MRLGPFTSSERNGRHSRTAMVEGSNIPASVTISLPARFVGDLDDASPLLGLGLWPAILAGEDLHVSGPVEAGHVHRARRVSHILRSWMPTLTIPTITVDEERTTAVGRGPGTAALFSRGVDSMFEAAIDTAARPALTHLLFIDGIEPRHSTAVAAAEVTAASRAADRLDLPLVVMETDAHALTGDRQDWSDVHGCVLAALGTAMGGQIGRVVVPSTDSYATLVPYGSHPLLDPLWSTSTVEILHGDISAGRASKVAALVDQRPDLLPDLKVCYEEDRVDNCGRCGKCLITMAALIGADGLELATGFPSTIDLELVAAMRPAPLQSRAHWVDVMRLLDERGQDPALRDAIAHALRRAARPDPAGWWHILREYRAGTRPTLQPSWQPPERGLDWANHTQTLRLLTEGRTDVSSQPLPPLPEPLRPPPGQ